jgi:hypothetical protein
MEATRLQADENPKSSGHGNPNWLPGTSQNPAGKESNAKRHARREAIIAKWAEPFGGAATLSPAERDLLHQAADLVLRKPHNAEDAVRIANTVSKILAQVGFVDKRTRRREPPAMTLQEYAASVAGPKASESDGDPP